MAVLIQNVEVNEECVDVLIDEGRVKDIGVGLVAKGPVFKGDGQALLPGLHDHHIHLNATAAAMKSVKCGPPFVTSESQLIGALNRCDSDELRGIGYHHSVGGEIDRAWLDKHGPQCPVRIQHRSGRLWILNSLAMDKYGLTTPVNGRLLDGDTTLRIQAQFPDLESLINKLLSYGITGVTEVTPSNGLNEWEHYLSATKPLRLSLMGRIDLTAAQSRHLKLHYHDHNLPALEALANEMRAAHRKGRNIAAHCVTRAELMLTLAALEMAGPVYGDRIEHAAIADGASIEWMKNLGVIIVTQPNFIAERRAAYVKDVPRNDHQNLWRLKAFQEAGLRLAAGSDAPFGDPNPWAAMQAAIDRPQGFEAESITPDDALSLYTKPADDAGAPARRVTIGAVADLCLLDRSWGKARTSLAAVSVTATWIEGELVYNRVN